MNGTFVWYDLITPDPAAAAAFYGARLGWTVAPADARGYAEIDSNGAGIGGMLRLDEMMRSAGARAGWLGYVAVADIEAAVREVEAAGGRIHRAPDAIPEIGSFAVVADPQGAVYQQFSALPGTPAAAALPMTPGRAGWHELMTSDPDATFDHYAGLYGWSASTRMDMGAMGHYQLFSAGGGDHGGIMRAPEGLPPFWLFYFVHPDIDDAEGRITALGGKILHGPLELPGGAWIIQAVDPEDAMFALVGHRPNLKE